MRSARFLAILGLALVLFSGPARAAASVTTSERTFSSVKRVVFAWTSAADGSATATTTAAFDGMLLGMITIPAGGGSAPTDNYDITVTDADGYDVLLGAGANRDTANTEYITSSSLAGVAASKLTFNLTNAGNAESGTLVLLLR